MRAGSLAVIVVAGCAPAPVVTTPAAPAAPTCGLEGCSRAAWVELAGPGGIACPAAERGCAGLSPAACTDDALARWGASENGRSLGCIAEALSDACAQGEARACAFAGRMWLDGRGLDKDVERGLRLLTAACDGGVALACAVGARFLGDGSPRDPSQDPPEAQRRLELEYACLSGEGEACMQVGMFFRQGEDGFPRDNAKAVAAYTRGCNLGESTSCNNLGDAVAYGEGVERDLDRAVELFDRACHLGDVLGCANLGFRFERGLGVARDVGRARALYRDACNTGNVYACLHVELLAAPGPSVVREPAAGLARWTRACQRGKDGTACAFVGILYDDGPDGLARDEARSMEAMERGCELGEPRACDWVRMHGGE